MDAPAVTVRCACGHRFQIPSNHVGSDVSCPSCKKSFKVSSPSPATPSKPKTPSTKRSKPGTASVQPPRPDLIPGYLIQKRLGSGGMGDVYLAKQQSLDRMVALKLLPEELAKDKVFVETFMKEARSAAKVSHENIVGAVDVGEANGRFYFVMEKVEGQTLYRQIRKQGALPEERALDFARQVAQGLRHAHKNGLIHRDIKPQNIMITPEGKAKILDFGLARDVQKEKQAGKAEFVVSTPAYASPEQCTGEAGIDHRTDIYSLGVTLYEMLTGQRPFRADTARRIMMKQVTDQPAAPQAVHQGVSRAANDLVLKMLEKEPPARPQTYDELIRDIDAITSGTSGEPAAAAPSPIHKRFPMPVMIGAAAAAVLLVVVLIFVFAGGEDEPDTTPGPKAPAAVRNPGAQKDLAEIRDLERKARGNPAQMAAVLAQWKTLEKRYRGKPEHGEFTTALFTYQEKVKAKADLIAEELIKDAAHKEGMRKFAEAFDGLARFPKGLENTDAHRKVAARKLEVERAMDRQFQKGMKQVEDIAGNERYEEALNMLTALRASLATRNDNGEKTVFARYAGSLDKLQRDLIAAEKVAKAPVPVVGVTPKPAPKPAPAPAPDTSPAPAAAAVEPLVAPPPDFPPDQLAHFTVLHTPAERADAGKRAPALTYFMGPAGGSPLYRAAGVFLGADERTWMLDGKVGEALQKYLPRVVVPNVDAITPDQHRAAVAELAGAIQTCGDVPVHALQLFASAHLRILLDRKETVDAAVALQARLGQAPISKVWGPSEHVGRVEMAGMLMRRPGLWLARAADASAGSSDFATRYLAALCAIKQTSVPVSNVEKRWRDLAGGAPSPEWSALCEKMADRVKLARGCPICEAKGKYPCGVCSSTGAMVCPTCNGAGTVIENPGTENEVKKRCSPCRGRKIVACGNCKARKNVMCGVCEGKKRLTRVVGSQFRYVVDLGLCEACSGRGTPIAGTGYPCFRCGGNGRHLDRVPKEFGRIPDWIEVSAGRAVFFGLRWLARHQASDGSWSPNGWKSNCPEKGCGDLSGDGFEVATTCIGLLAFLEAGIGPASKLELAGVESGEVVRRAIAWLRSKQNSDSGHIAAGTGSTPKPVFEHLVATYTLGRALNTIQPGRGFGQNEADELRQSLQAAVRFALAHQVKGEGWRYTPGAESDTWVTCWGAMALLEAKDAGVSVPKISLGYIVRWLDGATDKKDRHIGYTPAQMGKVSLAGQEAYVDHPTTSAFGALIKKRIEKRSSAVVGAADKLVKADMPSPEPMARDYAYWWVGTMYMHDRTKGRGTDWGKWVGALTREELLIQEAQDDCSLGSWPGNERWMPMGGRIYGVAMNTLALELAAGIEPRSSKRR